MHCRISTYPFASVSDDLNFLAVRVLSRVAVPFFLMTTGYFLRPKVFLKKTCLLCAGATLLYLPLSIYAGYFARGNLPAVLLRNLVFDGMFYHLWYLPASVLGVLLLTALRCKLPALAVAGIVGLLYVIGLLGDSYYGVTEAVPPLKALCDAGFRVFSYTRNGLFYAPVFLFAGACMAKREWLLPARTRRIGLALCAALMAAEGFALRHFGLQRHDSMYIMLLPLSVFLFQTALASRRAPSKFLRGLTMPVYILHPLMIVAVRGAAKLAGLEGLLIENSVVHFLAVTLSSFVLAACVELVRRRLTAKPFREGRAWIELDRNALRHNARMLRDMLPPGCALMPAVKADAYGHGAAAICRELNALGVTAFCVASAREGAALRKQRIRGEILVLGYTHPGDFPLLRRFRLTQTLVDCDYAETLRQYGKRLRVHIKIDTGMRRLGEPSDHLESILNVFAIKNLNVTGVYTHFSAQSEAFTAQQAERFRAVLEALRGRGISVPVIHAQSSYGLFALPYQTFDRVRVGLALYGAYRHGGGETGLEPVLSLKARVSLVKAVTAGERVGYGPAHAAPRDMRIAVLSIGYADGIPRALSGGVGRVLLRGAEAPTVGHICMDQMTVDITGIDGVRRGDTAVLIGRDADAEISVNDIAEHLGTVPNEILSRLGSRLERVLR